MIKDINRLKLIGKNIDDLKTISAYSPGTQLLKLRILYI